MSVMTKLERDVGQDRLAASEWMPRRAVCGTQHGGGIA